MDPRYELKRDPKGWTVVDRKTGKPTEPEGHPAVGLEITYATDLVMLLNAIYMKDRISLGRFF
ncbi:MULTISPECIES: hypothetical protein [unclassified Mesorhizobium]|uniref:hypothetical protein n=1 Tax=unclassified Mesorhizobium TaxID=325217 RepID=UPI00112D2382|nr:MULTISPECIES: hypothetical protein [unclassified Mesorhizobium]MBZ9701728.1 hypothetical protein [Mesorhizobium sp. CO1-1-3]MBZ9949076.1 hypothetical protein [Mesorhizobium sp. BR1-1-11]TPI99712.1 hypothetical protein FJ428_22625 [Mesorhizobium sp. B2-8-1]